MEGLASGTINWLVLPVLGGYWFQYTFNLTHYRAERLTPQRLVLRIPRDGEQRFHGIVNTDSTAT